MDVVKYYYYYDGLLCNDEPIDKSEYYSIKYKPNCTTCIVCIKNGMVIYYTSRTLLLHYDNKPYVEFSVYCGDLDFDCTNEYYVKLMDKLCDLMDQEVNDDTIKVLKVITERCNNIYDAYMVLKGIIDRPLEI